MLPDRSTDQKAKCNVLTHILSVTRKRIKKSVITYIIEQHCRRIDLINSYRKSMKSQFLDDSKLLIGWGAYAWLGYYGGYEKGN